LPSASGEVDAPRRPWLRRGRGDLHPGASPFFRASKNSKNPAGGANRKALDARGPAAVSRGGVAGVVWS